LQMNETHILIRSLRMYIPRNWEFGSALAKFRGGGGLNPPSPSVRHWHVVVGCFVLCLYSLLYALTNPSFLIYYVTHISETRHSFKLQAHIFCSNFGGQGERFSTLKFTTLCSSQRRGDSRAVQSDTNGRKLPLSVHFVQQTFYCVREFMLQFMLQLFATCVKVPPVSR
jgi:hypothetical protein